MTSTDPQPATTSTTKVLRERFRLPERFAQVSHTTDGSIGPGFFRTEGGNIAYGTCSSGVSDDANTAPLAADRGKATLPYDPDEVVDQLRFERYIDNALPDADGWNVQALVRRSYYFVRPMLSTKVRRIAQRRALAGWEKIPQPQWPVDTTVEELHRTALASAMTNASVDRVPIIWYWPNDYRGAITMTHDVEEAEGLAFSPELARIDHSFGFSTSFQVVPEVRYEVHEATLEQIRAHDCEISLHGLNHDGNLFSSREEFDRRAVKIASYLEKFDGNGFRSPVMYRNPDWIADLPITYDMSMPNVGHLDPQRGGCCSVFPYMLGDVVELPTTCTQDYTLFHVLDRYDLGLWHQQLDIIAGEYGLANFIVHPDYLDEPKALETYKALMAMLAERAAEQNLWKASPTALATWWNQRSQLELVESGGEWRIEGDGADQASIAWAELVDGEVVINPPA